MWVGMTVKPENVAQFLENGCGRCELGGTPRCKVKSWVDELRLLREIIQESGLREEIKWSVPCYTHDGKNILLLSALKESVTVSFLAGAALKDPQGLLEKPGPNSRFARYMRFVDAPSVASSKSALLAFIQQAKTLAASGEGSTVEDGSLPECPEELIQAFEANPQLEEAFMALTPGRQRGYLIHFSSAKQSKTRAARIEKYTPKILQGKGWQER